MKTQGIKIDEGLGVPTLFAGEIRSGYPYAGCFGGRVGICLVPRELAFLAGQRVRKYVCGRELALFGRCLGRLFVRLT
jgi:hypothetical protein